MVFPFSQAVYTCLWRNRLTRVRGAAANQPGHQGPGGHRAAHRRRKWLLYVSSWVDEKLKRCYQLMATHDRRLLDDWMGKSADLVDFEVYPVITSQEAAERIGPRL